MSAGRKNGSASSPGPRWRMDSEPRLSGTSRTCSSRITFFRYNMRSPRVDDMAHTVYGPVSWERMIRAVEKVRERLLKATAALEAKGIPYAVADGNAVAVWVSRVDDAAVRNTQDVD